MATVKLCDRCGKHINPHPMGGSRVITVEPGERFDLCPQCYVKFKEFMRGRELMPKPSSPALFLANEDSSKRLADNDEDTSSAGFAGTFPSRGRLDGEAEA